LAEPVTTNVLFAKGSGNPAFNHEVGAVLGTLAWTCAPSNTSHSGFMQTGPYLASLSKGTHTVYFRFAVDATNSAAMSLVRLDIRDSKKGTVLASRDVAWNEFLAPGESQAFGLTFTNGAPAGDLEFRAFWNHISNGPALTLIDTVVDAAHSWTAANLSHEIGQLDGMNAWCVDPARNHASGVLARGVNTREISAGWHSALFELKVDNFNWDNSKVATVSVVDIETGKICAMLDVVRSDFSTTLYQSVALKFKAEAGHRYDFQTFWHYAPHAPRLTQRSVIVK
jgi:hypothetical protein